MNMNEHFKKCKEESILFFWLETDNVYGNDLRFGSVALKTKDMTERKMTSLMGSTDRSIKYKWKENISSRLVELLLSVWYLNVMRPYYSLKPQHVSGKRASWKAHFNETLTPTRLFLRLTLPTRPLRLASWVSEAGTEKNFRSVTF